MPPLDAKPSGWVTFDSRGQAVWEWEISTGVFSKGLDAEKRSALETGNRLSLEEPADSAHAKSSPDDVSAVGDPRNQIAARAFAKEAPRRSLDDRRWLSEEIRRTKPWQSPAKKGP